MWQVSTVQALETDNVLLLPPISSVTPVELLLLPEPYLPSYEKWGKWNLSQGTMRGNPSNMVLGTE